MWQTIAPVAMCAAERVGNFAAALASASSITLRRRQPASIERGCTFLRETVGKLNVSWLSSRSWGCGCVARRAQDGLDTHSLREFQMPCRHTRQLTREPPE